MSHATGLTAEPTSAWRPCERDAAPSPSRYPVVDGRVCIELVAHDLGQLFDRRDPAPFRERDLDQGVVDYVMGAVEEIPRHLPLTLVVGLEAPADTALVEATIAEGVRSHFDHARAQLDRRLRQHVRRGRLALGVGLVVLMVCLLLAEAVTATASGHVRDMLREGLVIAGWVAVWRPLDVLLYDWWPLVDERRQLDRLRAARLVLRHAGA